MQKNNLNFLRLVGACLVLYGHSYVFMGLAKPLFLSWLPMGPLGVYIFFTISGYLIAASWDHDPHWFRFMARRALRIFPALVVCITLTVFVLGPLLTSVSLREYFSNQHTWGYFRNIAMYISYYLPGVFEQSRVPNAVNGSLWTLPVEFFMYITLSLIGLVKGNRWAFAAIAVLSILLTVFWARRSSEMLVFYASDLRQVFFYGTYFWVGAVFYKFNLARYFSISVVSVACILMLCLEPFTYWLSLASWVLLPTVVLAFGLAYSPALNWVTSKGDYSYGIYIYAFPTQQALASLYPDMSIHWYVFMCLLGTLPLAMLSWHFIEQPALRLKPRKK